MISLVKLLSGVLRPTLVCSIRVSAMLLASIAIAEPPDSSPQPAQATCSFDDGKQMYVRYHPDSEKNLPSGKVWAPGGQPMVLFTDTHSNSGTQKFPQALTACT